MTRRTNLLTLRKYFAWRSIWFQTDSYQGLVVRDLVINTFLSGVFRRLGIVSGHFTIRSTIFNINVIETELFFFHKTRVMPLFLLTNSFYEPFTKLVHSFKRFTEKRLLSRSKNTFNYPIDYFYRLLSSFKLFIFYCVYSLLPTLYPYRSKTNLAYFFFFKENFLYTSYSPVINYIYSKQQFNLFFCFLHAIPKSRFRSVSSLDTLQRSRYPLFTKSGKSGINFLSSRSNIFNQFSSRYPSLELFRPKKIVHYGMSRDVSSHNRESISLFNLPCNFAVCNYNSAPKISYSLFFVIYTYFSIVEFPANFTNLSYFFLLSRLTPIVDSIDDHRFSRTFFSNISSHVHKSLRRGSILFFYWFFKQLWISFFNSAFLNIADSISSRLITIFSGLNLIYNFVFFIFEKHKNSFFYNSLYITLFRQFNRYLCNKYSVSTSCFKNALQTLYSSIELSIRSYTGSTFFFIPRFFWETTPFITNSKIICEYLKLCLANGLTISSAYRKVSRWHRAQREYIKIKMSPAPTSKHKRPDLYSHFYKSQLKGIRITCSGPPYKARRKMRKRYHLWLAREFVSGIMPLQSLKFNIDYYQSYIKLKRSSIGIKVWTLFEKYEDKVFW